MKALLKLECIGDGLELPLNNYRLDKLFLQRYGPFRFKSHKRYWVAEITGVDTEGQFIKRMVPHKRSYREATASGNRGIYAYYTLEDGRVYEVSAPITWQREDRYFCRVTPDGCIVRISRKEVEGWLNAHSGSTSTMQPGSE